MKVYAVMDKWDNGEKYDDYYSETALIGIAASLEKAKEICKEWVPDRVARSFEDVRVYYEKKWNKMSAEEKDLMEYEEDDFDKFVEVGWSRHPFAYPVNQTDSKIYDCFTRKKYPVERIFGVNNGKWEDYTHKLYIREMVLVE